jgi:hypothetical protein
MRINDLLERLSYGQKVQILKEFMEFRQYEVLDYDENKISKKTE